ncbi:PspC domain-containing protein [Microvirga sp. STS02]|uniref:PspC domain-containing protein n=1 Tax=Hymenobacter negativus TaxID=2795026 RepID=UPI0018DE215F|nr:MULTISPECIES: PspC domain-containing protein [Bacteria]MBH8567267.1 PspC domain-containing protein [Hymenobacter negativus]MBR7206999.1 PspC domain-containing protein [Microvirga sp. STS02]
MKKNISINLQGIIFHIEEDGFDVLSRYLAEVKAHFANYRGHEDIVADIEGRIAELFSARLSPMQQVISLDDVNAMTAKMGRVSDFADEADEDDEVTAAEAASASANYGRTADSYTTASAAATAATATDEPKRLYRDMANRKVAGVAAGIAQYFAVNPLWIRLALIFGTVFSPAINIWSRHSMRVDFGGWLVLAYIILWILLPKRYDAPAHPEALLNSGPLAGRRLFRDTGTGKIAGVAAGLAAYFNIDVTLVRVIMLAGLFAGGFTFLLYIILWIVLPEAKTVSDKLRMRGDAITLESFDSSARNNAFADGPVTTNRPVGAFVEDAARALRPAVDFVGSAIRVVAGILLTMTGFGLLLALAIGLGASIGLFPNAENMIFTHVLLNGVPTWGLLAGFLAMGIPALALLLSGLNLLFRRSLMPRTVALSLLGIWLLSIVGVTVAAVRQNRNFQYDAEVEQLEQFSKLTTPVVMFDSRHVDRDWDQHVDVNLAAADSGKVVEVLRTLSAKGVNEAEARRTALTTIDYTVRPSGDSSLVFDDHFSFLPNSAFRKQELSLTIRLPRDRTFRMSRDFAYNILDDDDFVGNRRPEDPEQHQYRLRGNKLECIGCTEEQLGRNEEDNDNDGKMHINIDSDDNNDNADNNDDDSDSGDDEASNSGTTINYGGAPTFDTDMNSYGSARRTFQESGFSRVSVAGGYRVVVRHGDSFKIEAGGNDKALSEMRVELKGDELQIRPRNSGSLFGGNWGNNQSKVLIRIELPSIDRLELAGAVHADFGGFERQEELRVEQAGASHLRLNGSFGTLKLEQAGACRTTATGQADNLDLDAAGACELAGANLKTIDTKVSIAGVCKARLNVTGSLEGDAVGASEVAYSGKPSRVKMDATGPSSIKHL